MGPLEVVASKWRAQIGSDRWFFWWVSWRWAVARYDRHVLFRSAGHIVATHLVQTVIPNEFRRWAFGHGRRVRLSQMAKEQP